MSIFPKKVTFNEDVIIHLKFRTTNRNVQYYQYITSVYDPLNKEIFKVTNTFAMLGKNNNIQEMKKELYYCVPHDTFTVSGKYVARTTLYCNGHEINSSTIDNDYFLVEKIDKKVKKQYKENVCVTLTNTSFDVSIEYDIVDDKSTQIKKGIIAPNGKIDIRVPYKSYLHYGNNYVEPIIKEDVLVKKAGFNYTVKNNMLILRDGNNNEIELSNALAYIWLNCDGTVTVNDLTKKMMLDKVIVDEMVQYLRESELICVL